MEGLEGGERGGVPTPPATAARLTGLGGGVGLAVSVGAEWAEVAAPVVAPAAPPTPAKAVEVGVAPLGALVDARRLASEVRSERTRAVGSGGAVGADRTAVSTSRPAVARTEEGRKALGSLWGADGEDDDGDDDDEDGNDDGGGEGLGWVEAGADGGGVGVEAAGAGVEGGGGALDGVDAEGATRKTSRTTVEGAGGVDAAGVLVGACVLLGVVVDGADVVDAAELDVDATLVLELAAELVGDVVV